MCDDEALTLWDLVCRNRAPIDREARKLKRKREIETEESIKKETRQLQQELGGDDSELYKLFQPTHQMQIKDDVITHSSINGDLFNDMPYAPFAQTRPEEYDLFTEEANNHKLPPFAGAYKKTKYQKWSMEMTDRFYDAVETFGADTFLLGAHFSDLTDVEIKRKWDIEMRHNPERLLAAMNKKRKLTIDSIGIMVPHPSAQQTKTDDDDEWFTSFVAEDPKDHDTEDEDEDVKRPVDVKDPIDATATTFS